MPTTYTITVKNKSGTERDYFLFIEKPKLNTGERFYHNVYMTAPGVDSYSGRAIFTCHTNYYAVCGTSPRALDANVRVDTADSAPVRLSQGTGSPGTHLYMSGGLKPDGSGGTSARFVNSETKNDCTEPGAFQIDCHDFKANNGCKLVSRQIIVLVQQSD